jgi:hypothetical protein
MNVENLAKSGFYYFNQGDSCQCIYCLIIISDWTETDIPKVEHRKWSPACPFILKLPVGNIPSKNTGVDETRTPDLSSFTAPISKGLSSPVICPNAVSERSPRTLIVPECGTYDYHQTEIRLKTFKLWPKLCQTKEEMAEAGFLYTGFNDNVKCPFCKITINQWMPEENPKTKHLSISPECTFVKKYLAP